MCALISPEGISAELDKYASDYNKGYIVSIEIEHHKIHEGYHFGVHDFDEEVDIAAPKYWHFKAPNTATRCHFTFEASAGLPGLLEVYRDSTITDNGTLVASMNNDQNSATVAEMIFYKDPTVSDVGTTKLCSNFLGSSGANPVGASGGITMRNKEIILKQGSSYIIKFTAWNNDAPISICLDWYEVEPENA